MRTIANIDIELNDWRGRLFRAEKRDDKLTVDLCWKRIDSLLEERFIAKCHYDIVDNKALAI